MDTAYSKVVFATSNGLLFDFGLIVAQASQVVFEEQRGSSANIDGRAGGLRNRLEAGVLI